MAGATIDPGGGTATNTTDSASTSSNQSLPSTGWSVLAWVRHGTFSGNEVLIGFGTGAAASSFQLRTFSGAQYGVQARDASGANVTAGAAYPAAGDVLVAATYNGTNFLRFYLVPKGSTVSAESDGSSATYATITPSAGWYWFSDGTDFTKTPAGEFAVVGRQLSNAELTTLASGQPITAVEPSPLLYHQFRRGAIAVEPNLGTAASAGATLAGSGWANAAEFFPIDVRPTGVSSLEQALRAEEPLPNSALVDVQSWWGPQLGVEKWMADELSVASGAVTITTTTGDATAAGVNALIDQQRKIATTTGDAVANGATAAIDQKRSIATTTGNAVADGVTAQIDQKRVIATTTGNAVANGPTAQINGARVISTTAGNAVADGAQANIDQKRTVTGIVGNAVADGATAAIDQKRSIAATPGDAVANGTQAQIDAQRVITTTPGNAIADGPQASVGASTTITTIPGNAVADGIPAAIVLGLDQPPQITIGGSGGEQDVDMADPVMVSRLVAQMVMAVIASGALDG